ncbi:hypothetical protein AVEN_29111-1 [Araneus ventricosus]|uniref:DUF4371 domain-containing protein n=1 Tax=Araneus ventricosus TaxID=182803 RepID=A0A4Y2AKE2_ARAVE|nr:hypothetical protein AVEN_29111-1 [Araneus ventricosus]
MAEVVRFVDISFEERTLCIRERFLGFVLVSVKEAESLVECILNQLRNDAMNLDDCRSQCYDNVAIMAGYETASLWEKLVSIPITVKSESETRWSSRAEPLKPVNKYLDELLDLLNNTVEDADETPETRSDARNLCNRMLTYDFLTLLGF